MPNSKEIDGDVEECATLIADVLGTDGDGADAGWQKEYVAEECIGIKYLNSCPFSSQCQR